MIIIIIFQNIINFDLFAQNQRHKYFSFRGKYMKYHLLIRYLLNCFFQITITLEENVIQFIYTIFIKNSILNINNWTYKHIIYN